uniref:Major facilitator superfamily (MFS) profile domain-containing protein n=1 Tax=Megaselia scalaris TaxID=36166 RepID=T1GP45_MEGSC
MTLESDKADGFDRALELTIWKFNAVIIFLAGIVLGTIYLESTTMNFVLPISQCDIHWTQNERNLLGAVTYIGIIISSHFWGSLGDSKGRKIVLCPTLIVGFILSLLSSFSNSFAVMFTLRLFNGIW